MYAFKVPRARGGVASALALTALVGATTLGVSPAHATSEFFYYGTDDGWTISNIPVWGPRHPLTRVEIHTLPGWPGDGFPSGCAWAQNSTSSNTPSPTATLLRNTLTYINTYGDVPPQVDGSLAGHPSCTDPNDNDNSDGNSNLGTYRVYNGTSYRRGVSYKNGLSSTDTRGYVINGYEYW